MKIAAFFMLVSIEITHRSKNDMLKLKVIVVNEIIGDMMSMERENTIWGED